MTIWSEYMNNSLGVKISIGVCILLAMNIMICVMMEKKRLNAGMSLEDQKVRSIGTIKRLWIGMLAGFVVTICAGVAQFIVRFGYFTLLQEIGVVFLGIIGAVVGGLCGIINRRGRAA
jgi:hypothetical protein